MLPVYIGGEPTVVNDYDGSTAHATQTPVVRVAVQRT